MSVIDFGSPTVDVLIALGFPGNVPRNILRQWDEANWNLESNLVCVTSAVTADVNAAEACVISSPLEEEQREEYIFPFLVLRTRRVYSISSWRRNLDKEGCTPNQRGRGFRATRHDKSCEIRELHSNHLRINQKRSGHALNAILGTKVKIVHSLLPNNNYSDIVVLENTETGFNYMT